MKPVLIGVISAIVIGVIIIGIIFSNQGETGIGVEQTPDDREYEDLDPQIQEKLEEKEKINLENEYNPKPREWITSGPFQIDRSQYVLGEKIFVRINELSFEEKGQIAFLRPMNDTHYEVYLTVPFDGAAKESFNYYIDPQLSRTRGLCSMDDIVGNWTVVFRGTNYPNLKFEITDQILPGSEEDYEIPVC